MTPHVQLHESEKLTYEKAGDIWRSSMRIEWEVSKKPFGRFIKAYLKKK